MINIIQNTIGALGRVLGIVRKNLQLWLDFTKSEVIGSDLVVNGDFDDGSNDWGLSNATLNLGGVEINNVGLSNANAYVYQENLGKVGSSYRITYDVIATNGKNLTIEGTGSDEPLNTSTVGVDRVTEYVWTKDSGRLLIKRDYTETPETQVTIDNIRLQEVTQFVKDKSPNTNNAKLFTGKALSFDGNDYVDCGDVGANKTLAFWFNPTTDITSSTPYQRLFGFNTTYHGITLGAATGSLEGETLTVLPDATGGSRTATTMDFDAGVWYRVVVVWNATSSYYDIYVNGYLKTDLVSGTANETSWDSFFIGKDNATSQTKFNGSMSDVQIYNVALSESDITFDYNNPNLLAIDNPATDLVVTDLKAYWALNEGDGLVAYDSGSTLEEDVVQNGDFSELGVEEVVNGDFAEGLTGWDVAYANTTLSINESELRATANSSGAYGMSQELNLSNGSTYQVTSIINVDNASGGTANLRIAENSNLSSAPITLSQVTGTITTTFVATSNTMYIGIVDTATDSNNYVEIDNISVKQVDPNDDWDTASGAGASVTIKEGRVDIITNGDAAELKQTNIFEVTKRYQVTVDAIINSGAGVKVGDSNDDDIIMDISSTGVYTAIFVATGVDFEIAREGGSASNSTINSVSVTEITPSDHGGLVIGATYVDKQPTIPQLGMMDWAKGSNLYLNSEPTGAEGPESDVTYGSYSWGLNGFSNATIFGDNSVLRYRYGSTILASTEYTISCFVIMDDLSEPNVSLVNVVGDFGFVLAGTASGGVINANQSMGNNIWRVSKTATSGTSNLTNNGVIKYTGQSSTGFKVVGYQLEESSSAGNYILTDGAEAINVTTIQNPTNKGYDILGNALRLREHAFNLDGSGYAEVAISSSLSSVTNGTVQFWLKNSSTSNFVLFNNDGDNYLGAWNGNLFYDSESGTITQYADSNSTVTSVKITDGSWHMYTFTGVDLSGYAVLDISNYSSSFMVDSIIDDIVVYDRVLTSKEITNNYKFGLRTHS